ncbi:hypothetical protein QFC22_002191 [Naganishia vaughanmartiniae]|uniref:Uncharacterized protein n=1 Tax=Naganishia vaughanmartiniae TaxID=1424756 RepID=A0ACC2XE75_9TREE|nr:hypothetical protein QFC22_002191 [Naganishia vaughanmartiniae]
MPNPSIVDKLVRAAAAVPTDIPDDQLNRHVADLLAKEAKEKEAKWREMGIGVYLNDKPGSSSRAPKANTRFLKSIVRDVDGHNTALLRQQAEAAKAAALDKFYSEPKSKDVRDRRRDTEGSSAGRNRDDPDIARMRRLFGGAVASTASSRSRDGASRTETRGDHHSATGKSGGGGGGGGSGGAAGSWRRDSLLDHSGKRRRLADGADENSEDEERGWSRRDVGTRKPRSAMKRAEEEEELESQRRERIRDGKKRDEKMHNNEPSLAKPSTKHHAVAQPPVSEPASTSSIPAIIDIPSKMDRYFEPAYDPKKDYRAMLDAQETAVPLTGLVPDVDVGWDSMLSTIKYRGQDRERARERERDRDRDRDTRNRPRAKEYTTSKSSREKETSSSRKRSRRDECSPSIIFIRDSTSESLSSESESDTDSWSSASDSSAGRRHRKRRSTHRHSEYKSSRREGKKDRHSREGKSSSSRGHTSGKKRSGEKKRRRSRSDDERERERKKVHVGGYEYVAKGAVREWDMGK